MSVNTIVITAAVASRVRSILHRTGPPGRDGGGLMTASQTVTADFAITAASNGIAYEAGAPLTLTLPDPASLGPIKFGLFAESGDFTVDGPGTLIDRAANFAAITAVTGDDGRCEVENVGSVWILTRGVPVVMAADIEDSGTCGRAVVRAETPSAAMTELGAGTTGASLFTAATETAAHTTLGRRVFHLDATETVNTLTAATFPGLSAISLKANTHYRISGWLRWECIAASFNLNLGFTGTGIDFDGTETNGRSFILTNATGGVEAMNNQSASSTRPFFTGVSSITRKCRSTFDGFILTAGNATNMNVQIVNRIAASGTVAVRDGVIIIEEVF